MVSIYWKYHATARNLPAGAPISAVPKVEDDVQPQLEGGQEGGPEEGRQLLLHVHHHLVASRIGDCAHHSHQCS